MKQFLIIVCLMISLCSCRGHKKCKNTSVLEDKKSLINRWYGNGYFDQKEPQEQTPSQSLNKDEGNESYESTNLNSQGTPATISEWNEGSIPQAQALNRDENVTQLRP